MGISKNNEYILKYNQALFQFGYLLLYIFIGAVYWLSTCVGKWNRNLPYTNMGEDRWKELSKCKRDDQFPIVIFRKAAL
jgi:hypothetical protein